MIKTNNLNVSAITPIIAPAELRQVFPLSAKDRDFVSRSRSQIKEILQRRDRRLEQERDHGQAKALRLRFVAHLLAEGLQLGDVGLFLVGDVGDGHPVAVQSRAR